MSNPRGLDHRPDIDGLRAVAVLAVVGFHALGPWVPGGFVGVDVFFVVSGFLITGIVADECKRGDFSLARFYRRRARRILPALVTMVAAVLGLGWFLLLPSEFAELGRHAVGAALFASNLVLWQEAGYFDTAAEVKPLLHLWSLGIEEQFYLLWPLLLAGLWRWRLLWATAVLALISLGWNVVTVAADPVAAFYLPHQRIWELLAGALVAIAMRQRRGHTVFRSAGLMSALGLLLILTSIAALDPRQPFPGLAAIPPVLGTALVILSGPQAWPNRRLLAAPALVGVGLISYPLYLWHWPLLSFARILEGRDPALAGRVSLVAVAVVLAALTWRFIEQPVRRGRLHGEPVRLPLRSLALVGAIGLVAFPGEGVLMAARGMSAELGQRRFHEFVERSYPPCADASLAAEAPRWRGYLRCHQSRADAPVDVVLVGDSHAEHLFPGLAAALPQHNLAYHLRDPQAALDPRIVDLPSVHTIVLAYKGAKAWEELRPRLREAAARLEAAGKRVYLADDVPMLDHPVESCVRHREMCSFERALPERRAVLAALDAIGREAPSMRRLGVWKQVCPSGNCQATIDGVLLYRDEHHLGVSGSLLVGRRLVEETPELRTVPSVAGRDRPGLPPP